MKVIFLLIAIVLVLWPIIMWSTYQIAGWKKWEKLFRRDVTHDTDVASSVSFKKFGNYNRVVRIGIEDYGVSFRPTIFLLFHKSFSLPWSRITSFEYKPGRLSSLCTLHTQMGDINIYGDVAEVVAHACKNHYVVQTQ